MDGFVFLEMGRFLEFLLHFQELEPISKLPQMPVPPLAVIPAKAGIQCFSGFFWMPASAGMTNNLPRTEFEIGSNYFGMSLSYRRIGSKQNAASPFVR